MISSTETMEMTHNDKAMELDPRIKLLWLIGSSFVLLSNNLLLVSAVLGITLTVLMTHSQRGRQDRFLSKAGPIYLSVYFIITFLLVLLLLRDVTIALLISFKLLTIAVAAVLYFEITRPSEMLETLRSLRIPSSLALALGVGIRFIPIVFEEARKILLAQRARGLGTGRGITTLFHLPTVISALSVPLLINIFSRVNDLWLAINVRGVGTLSILHRRQFRWTWLNTSVVVYTLLIMILSIIT